MLLSGYWLFVSLATLSSPLPKTLLPPEPSSTCMLWAVSDVGWPMYYVLHVS